ATVGLLYGAGVQLLGQVNHKTSQAVLIQPAFTVTRQVDRLVAVNVDKVLADRSYPVNEGLFRAMLTQSIGFW
ncbi:MAG: hypothetical protein Q8S52_00505, partial [Methylobacter sp.]|nr:hypothetical protein [Methylobacter sp.]MDP3360595.1 hypothetical protein [Methylobacter sp.]